MYGQGGYAPQFRQNPPQHPPPFQQGRPHFQQGPLPPPPPPPVNHEGRPAVPPGLAQPAHHHHMYQHGPPPPPPLQQGGPPRPPQPYMHPSPSGYANSPMTLSSTNPQQNAQFPPPMPPTGATISGSSNPETIRTPLPPRIFPPPPSQGQMLYVTQRHPPPPPPPSIGQGIQHGQLLPPPPSGFVSVTPASFVSLPQAPPEHAHPPSIPPPPPPPPPSSPPPLPPSPPPPLPASPEFSAMSFMPPSTLPLEASSSMPQQMEFSPDTNRISEISESVIDPVDKGVASACTSDGFLARIGHLTNDGRTSCATSMLNDEQASTKLSTLALPPPKPAASEVVRQIEVLCQYIVKNGSDFELVARTKEHGNPKFAFLFGGEPGSEAAIAHEYFQWMKRKYLMDFKLQSGSEQSGSPSKPSKAESSPADSDMDTEDDTQHFNDEQDVGLLVKDSKEAVSTYRDVRNQHVENQCLKEEPIARSSLSSYGSPVLASTEREYDHIPHRSPAEVSECTFDASTKESTRPIKDSTQSKASPLAAPHINYKEDLDPISKIGSPFRLIQDYASDDSGDADDGPSFEDVSPERVSPSITVGNTSLQEEGINVEKNMESSSTHLHDKGMASPTDSSFLCPTSLPSSMSKVSEETSKVVETTVVVSDASDTIAKPNELPNDSHDYETPDMVHEDALRGDRDVDSHNEKFQKGNETTGPGVLKVDEFGRMVREGVNDSDSDADHYTGKRNRRGRSRSPLDRRRRRSRSPRRRNEKRNRSRSWSPRKRRSMSKSRSPPAFRHTGNFSGDKMKRDRDQIPDCYDFLKGRCYRGASCRFQHHGSGTGDAARSHRGRQQQHMEAPEDSRKSVLEGDYCSTVADEANLLPAKLQQDVLEEEHSKENMNSSNNTTLSDIDVPKDWAMDGKTEAGPLMADAQLDTAIVGGQSATPVRVEVSQSCSQEETKEGINSQIVQQVLETPAIHEGEDSEPPVDINQPLAAPEHSTEPATQVMSGITPSSSEPTLTEKAVHHPSEVSNGVVLESTASLLGERPLPAQNIDASIPSSPESSAPQLLAPGESQPPQISAENFQFQHSQLPLPPPPPPPPLDTAHVSQPLGDYNLPPASTNAYSQSAQVERYPPYQAPLNDQNSQAPVPSTLSWTSLPPPPPFVHGSTPAAVGHTQGSHLMHLQQNTMPLMRPYQHGEPSHTQAIEFHPPTFPPTGELHRPLLHTDGIMRNQPFEYPKVLRDERFPHSSVIDGNRFHPGPPQMSSMHPPHQRFEEHHFPFQGHDGSRNSQTFPNQRFTGFMTPDNMRAHAVPFPNELHAKQVQAFPDSSSYLNSFPKENFGAPTTNHSFTAQQHQQLHQPTFGMQWSGASSFPSHLGSGENVGPSARRYPMSFDDDSKLPHLSSAGGSRISAHYNPFASTFENIPDSAKYTSNFKKESLVDPIMRYDSLGLNQASSPDLKGGLVLRKSGDPYDPLFDSIEPSSKASRKFEHFAGNITSDVLSKSVAVRSTIDSFAGTKSKRSHKAIAIEEKEQIEAGTAAITTSPENDEFGETAIDTEAGAVDSESPSPDNLVDTAEKATGDVEIDQVQSKGKSKKSKDSRSMKLFKVALADFVKDVLKPSWRQGNMSKEAFKTIVKKTVDKVAGAMKTHQIPKGQAKINQYVESSQRKLTKLVMGYVDKYVKA